MKKRLLASILILVILLTCTLPSSASDPPDEWAITEVTEAIAAVLVPCCTTK